jgi:hypothetical protein
MHLSLPNDAAKGQLLVATHSWKINNEDPINPTSISVAALLYKEIMRLTILDTRATNKALRDNLKALPEFCVQVKGDVNKVNAYLMKILNQLLSQCEGADNKETSILLQISMFQMQNSGSMGQKKDNYYNNINDMANAAYKAQYAPIKLEQTSWVAF